jgi:hypothetical protein
MTDETDSGAVAREIHRLLGLYYGLTGGTEDMCAYLDEVSDAGTPSWDDYESDVWPYTELFGGWDGGRSDDRPSLTELLYGPAPEVAWYEHDDL